MGFSTWHTREGILLQLFLLFFKIGLGDNFDDLTEMKIFVGDSGVETRIENFDGFYDGPYFDPASSVNITVEVGHVATLPCVVRRIEAKVVSWVRKKDSAIMTVDDYVVISDNRVDVIKTSYLSEWKLVIKNTKETDTGYYECQVSTEQKKSQLFYLFVKVPNLKIEGSPEIFTKTGSTISLKCIVKGSSTNPEILWFHQSSHNRGGVPQTLEQNSPSNKNGEWILENVVPADEGNYSCRTRHSAPASVILHVVPGERIPEAMLEEEVRSRAGQLEVPVFYLQLIFSLFSQIMLFYKQNLLWY